MTKKKLAIAPGYGGYDSIFTFTEATQQEYMKQYDAQYPPETRTPEPVKEIKFEAPRTKMLTANTSPTSSKTFEKGVREP